MPIEDKQLGIRIMREFTKRASIDSSDVRIYTSGGVVYLNGKLKVVRGAEGLDLKKELDIIQRNLRTVPGVREVVNEMDMRSMQ